MKSDKGLRALIFNALLLINPKATQSDLKRFLDEYKGLSL